MTRYDNDISPPRFNAPCEKCEQIRVHAERAFRELRHEADAHIEAVERKLRDDFARETTKLRAANQQLQQELSRARSGTPQPDRTLSDRIPTLESDLRARDATIAKSSRDYESMVRKYSTQISSLEEELRSAQDSLADVTNQLMNARQGSDSNRTQIHKTVSEYERQLQQLQNERNEYVLANNSLKNKLAASESAKQELELERARLDLAYRRRIGEMEMEVRRSDIESVRLRRQIMTQGQKIEALERGITPSLGTHTPQLFSADTDVSYPEQPRKGMITRINSQPDTPKSFISTN
jgi:chromosome segregation ATPase